MDPRATDRYRRAVEAIDQANAPDPRPLVVRGRERPKALGEAELVTEWIERLCPEASEPLLLAARAHHLRRWTIPRADFPDGRAGYLRWRRALHEVHAGEVATVLEGLGYDAATVARVQEIVRKRNLAKDPEVQALEDAICLTFIETQFEELAGRLDHDKTVDVVRKTLLKMSDQAKQAAAGIPLGEREQQLLAEAVATPANSPYPGSP